MELTRWKPMNDLFSLNRQVGCMLDDMFRPFGAGVRPAAAEGFVPRVDIYEEGGNTIITAELPGVAKEDIRLDVKEGVLTLKGERNSTNEVKEDNYYRKERVFGRFERAFRLPADVNPDVIKADFKDGVLKIEIPKAEETQPRMITVH